MTREMEQSCLGTMAALFSSQPLRMMSRNPRKRAPGKMRARQSIKSRYNPIKVKRPNTPEIKVTELDAIDTGPIPS